MDIEEIKIRFSGQGVRTEWSGYAEVQFPTGEIVQFDFSDDPDMTPILAQLQAVIKERVKQRLRDWGSD